MHRSRTPLALAATALLLLLAGCPANNAPMPGPPANGGQMDDHMGGHMGGSAGNSANELTDVAPGTQSAEIIAQEYSFSPSRIEAKAGPASITVENRGQIVHDFTVDALGIHFNVAAGQTVTKAYKLEPGQYEFYCSVAGHKQLGMVGTLSVS